MKQDFYFCTIQDGEIATFSRGYPPQELRENQFEVTWEEFKFLQAVEGDMKWAKRQLKALIAKMKANGH